MTDLKATRTLVKSGPELWAECSDAASLARHLGAFGEIRITRLEPETAVAWEGDAASGTVRLEPSGWGTRVVLTATPTVTADGGAGSPADPAPEPDPAAEPEPESESPAEPEFPPEPEFQPGPEIEPETETQPVAAAYSEPAAPGPLARLLGRFGHRRRPAPVPEPEPVRPEPEARAEIAREPEHPAEIVHEPEAGTGTVPGRAHASPQPPTAAALDAVLDSLGRAHHRPYSRA